MINISFLFLYHNEKYISFKKSFSKETIGDHQPINDNQQQINAPYSTNVNDQQNKNTYTSMNGSGNIVSNNAIQDLKSYNEKGLNQELLSNQSNKLKSENKAYRNLLFKFINSKPYTNLEVQYTPNNDNTGNTIILKAKGIGGNKKYQNKGKCKSKD